MVSRSGQTGPQRAAHSDNGEATSHGVGAMRMHPQRQQCGYTPILSRCCCIARMRQMCACVCVPPVSPKHTTNPHGRPDAHGTPCDAAEDIECASIAPGLQLRQRPHAPCTTLSLSERPFCCLRACLFTEPTPELAHIFVIGILRIAVGAQPCWAGTSHAG